MSFNKKVHGKSHGIELKKQFGQHFLRDQSIVDSMLKEVDLKEAAVFEIGCGDGFLTSSILKKPAKRLWIFEIDHNWAKFVSETFPDARMVMHESNILDIDFSIFNEFQPWTLLSNLPYQITFPLLYKLQANRHLLKEGVVMVQEEVAQKIVKTYGRGYGFPSLYFQHYFEWKLLNKIPPGAFYPPPKVTSRLLYFKPRKSLDLIPQEEKFWEFIKRCFASPRRTLKNNLQNFHYDLSLISAQTLALRAQQMSKADFLNLWDILNK